MTGPKWRQVGTQNRTATCVSCGLVGVILQGTGAKEWKNVGGRYFCWKDICLEASKKPITTMRATPAGGDRGSSQEEKAP